jgi:hypothetical protein
MIENRMAYGNCKEVKLDAGKLANLLDIMREYSHLLYQKCWVDGIEGSVLSYSVSELYCVYADLVGVALVLFCIQKLMPVQYQG